MTPAQILAKEKAKAARESLELAMLQQLRALSGLPPVRQHRFHPVRQWRFDFAWPHSMLALEVDGGTRTNGRHNRGDGIDNDCRKYAEAQLLGWRVLRVTGDHVKSGEALRWVEGLLARCAA